MASRFIARGTGTYQLAANTLGALLLLDDVRLGTDRGDGGIGTLEVTGTGATAADIYSYFTAGTRADAFKATGFSTHSAADVVTALGNGSTLTEAGGTGDHLTALATAAALTTVDNEIAAIDTLVKDIPTNAEFALRTLATAEYATAANLATAYLLIRYIAPPLIGTIANAGEGTETYVYGGVTVTYTVNEDGDRAVVAIT